MLTGRNYREQNPRRAGNPSQCGWRCYPRPRGCGGGHLHKFKTSLRLFLVRCGAAHRNRAKRGKTDVPRPDNFRTPHKAARSRMAEGHRQRRREASLTALAAPCGTLDGKGEGRRAPLPPSLFPAKPFPSPRPKGADGEGGRRPRKQAAPLRGSAFLAFGSLQRALRVFPNRIKAASRGLSGSSGAGEGAGTREKDS